MNKSIGNQLKAAREARSLTLQEVSGATYMRTHYLQALEAGDFESLPSNTQARGFLRTYASYLGLDADALLAELDSPAGIELSSEGITPEPQIPETGEELEAPPETAFSEVGQSLLKRRETLGLSLADVERHTSLRQHNLEALEAGDLDALPSPVQGRGMLKNYAVFLGMDPDPLLIRFAQGLQARLPAKKERQTDPQVHRKPILPARVRRILSGDVLIAGTIGVFLVIFVAWVAVRVFAMQSETVPTATAPSIVDVLIASPSPTSTIEPDSGTPAPAQVLVSDPSGTPLVEATLELPGGVSNEEGVNVYITVNQRAWVRVTVDDEIALVGRVLPGSAYSFSAESQIELLTGNGQALLVFYNDQDLGRIGEYGEVVNLVFSLDGILQPTPTVTPTATSTPRVTPTAPVLPDAGTSIPPLP
jgi:cytoskeletal protein RodZ